MVADNLAGSFLDLAAGSTTRLQTKLDFKNMSGALGSRFDNHRGLQYHII